MRVHFTNILSAWAVACIMGFAASSHAAIIDNLDTYPGASGGGWAGGWGTGLTNATQSPGISDTDPLTMDGEDYLNVTATLTSPAATAVAVVRRRYSNDGSNGSDVNVTTELYKISFDYRVNTALGDSMATDAVSNRYNIVGSRASTTGTLGSNTWIAGVWAGGAGVNASTERPNGFSTANNANHWIFLNNTSTDNAASMGAMSFWDSGLTLDPETVYHFDILIDPVNGEYRPTISDGNTTAVAPGFLGFRNKTGNDASTYLQFHAFMTAASTSLSYSVDNIVITVPEPNASLLASIGMVGASVFCLRRRNRARN